MPPIVTLVIVLVLGLATFGTAFVLGMRAKSPLVLDPIIWFSRKVLNPRQMRSAGTPGAYAGVIRHRGRVSGRAYATPVGIVPADDGFLIALPYGTHAQWLRNVLASGSATIDHEGHTYAVDRPELIPMDAVADHFPVGDRRSARLLRTDRCLRLRRVEALERADRVALGTAA